MSKLFNLLLTLPFGSQTDLEEETDGLGLQTLSPRRNMNFINSKQLMVDAINLAKKTVAQIKEQQLSKEESEGKQENIQIIAYKEIEFRFKLKKILFSLFEGPLRDPSFALATAQLIKFQIFGELLTDGSLQTTCLIGDLFLNDDRTSRKDTGIKTLLEKKLVTFLRDF
jgi:hypothetical protein